MARHVLFCIHGMGEHGEDWHEAGIKVLRAAFSEYELIAELDFDETFDPVPLVYDDILAGARARANADFAAFRGAVLGDLSNAGEAARGEVESRLDGIGQLIGAGDDGFLWTHVLDVVLYRFARTMRMGIDVSIAEKLMGKLAGGGHASWSVLAHSLGTSVAHNVLNSLYNTGFPNAPGGPLEPLDPVETRCRTLAMIANVSRVLQRQGAKVYESRVRPGSATAGRLCAYYLNARHKLDPFTVVRPFDPDVWPDAVTFNRDRYQALRPGHIRFSPSGLRRVHDFDHYLMNPRVHVPLFRSILGRRIISEEEFAQARADFDAHSDEDSVREVRARLEAMLPAAGGSWGEFLDMIRELGA